MKLTIESGTDEGFAVFVERPTNDLAFVQMVLAFATNDVDKALDFCRGLLCPPKAWEGPDKHPAFRSPDDDIPF